MIKLLNCIIIITALIFSFGFVPKVYANINEKMSDSADITLPVLPKYGPLVDPGRKNNIKPIFNFLGEQDLSSGSVIVGTSVLLILILLFLLIILFFANRRKKEEEEKYTLSSKYDNSKIYSNTKPNSDIPILPAHTQN